MLGCVFRRSAVYCVCTVLCWGRKHCRRLDRLTVPLVGSGGGSEENLGPTFGQNMWIYASFLHDLPPQGYHVFCSFHI